MSPVHWIRVISLCLTLHCAAQLSIQHSSTAEEISWGLMQVRELAEDQGMLFHFSPPQRVSFWMFNTFIDLAIAFIDEEGTIVEICEMRAYPEMMSRLPPVEDYQSLKSLNPADAVLYFFRQRATRSTHKASYALEMSSGWFTRNQIEVNDSVLPLIDLKLPEKR